MLLHLTVLLLAQADGGRAEAPLDPIEATRFVHGAPEHGVPGPWVLTGFRIGANALQRLGLTRAQAFELEVIHRTVPKVQFACMADGLMAATGASPGKLNLTIEKVSSEKGLESVVIHKKSKRKLIYRLRAPFIAHIREVDFAQFPEAAAMLAGMADDDLFTVEEQKVKGP